MSRKEYHAKRIEREEFVRRLAERMQTDEATAARWLDGVLEEMYQTFRSGCGLTLPDFGGFYPIGDERAGLSKFNPGQKLRALFGCTPPLTAARYSTRARAAYQNIDVAVSTGT